MGQPNISNYKTCMYKICVIHIVYIILSTITILLNRVYVYCVSWHTRKNVIEIQDLPDKYIVLMILYLSYLRHNKLCK